MKSVQKLLLSFSSLLLISGLALAAPVSARGGDGSGGSTLSGSGSHDSVEISDSSSTSDDSTTGTETETEVENHAHDLAEQFRVKARSDVAEKKTHANGHSQEQRQKSCEARKTNLTKRMTNAVAHAQKHKEVFDKIYSRAKAFHDNKQLDTPDYSTMVAKTDAAQADAAASISALNSLNVTVDCGSQTVADSVSAFQQAVKGTRDSLKTYRASIVELMKALKNSNGATDNSSTDTTSNNPETAQ